MTSTDLLTPKEAAHAARVKLRCIYKWVRDGLLKPVAKTPSGRILFAREDVLRQPVEPR